MNSNFKDTYFWQLCQVKMRKMTCESQPGLIELQEPFGRPAMRINLMRQLAQNGNNPISNSVIGKM